MKKILSALLLAAVMLGACGEAPRPSAAPETAAPAGEAGTAAETAAEEAVTDYGGYEFTLLNGNVSYTYRFVTAEEENGDIMNDSIYRRNIAVEDALNIKIRENVTDNPQSDYMNSITAGDNAFDVALLRMEWVFPIVIENGTVNWNSIPHLDLSQPYWIQGSLTSMSLMNNIYFGVSAFDTSHLESIRAIVFNKRMAEDFGIESPYETVKSGKWTIQKLYDNGLSAASDLDGNGKWTKKDRFGMTGYSNVICNTIMTGVGSILSISKDANDAPYFDLDADRHVERLLTVSKMFAEDNGFCDKKNNQDLFREGNALYRILLLSEVTALRDMDDDFGIIPTPKYDENQENYINLGGSPFFMTVPVTSPDLERTGAVMEALASYSAGVIDTAYYDIVLKGKVSRDDESAGMLDLIISTLEYYHPLANSYLNAPLADDYIWKGKTDFASYFASVKDSINAEIDQAIETYTANVK